MKKTRLAILSLSAVLILTGCNNAKSNSSQEENKSSSSKPAVQYNITLETPEDTSMLASNVKEYIDAMHEQEEGLDNPYLYDDLKDDGYVDVANFLDEGEVEGQNRTVNGAIPDRSDKNMGVDLEFTVKEGHEADEYKVLVADNDTFENAKELTTENNKVNVQNLFASTKYYWKVVGDDEASDIGEFTTGDYPRWISARPMYNVRDMGGYMTDSGKRVKQGLVYRGGEITIKTWGDHSLTATEESKKVFREDMGMVGGLEIDLRGTGDIGDGYKANAFAENGDIAYEMLAIKSYNETFSKNGSGATNPTQARQTVAKIFEHLKEADKKPVYYHCYGGADRTGTLGFLLNGLLGVSYSDLVIDFELTSYSSINNEHIRSHLRDHQYDHWRNLINFVKTDTTNGYAYNENAPLKENIYNLLHLGCNVPTETLDTIRNIMIEK